MTVSFSASYVDVDAGYGPTIVLAIAGDAFELHVALRVSEVARLDEVLSTPWQGGALHVGTAAGVAAWWSCDNGEVAICVGHDEQTWDFGISFPASELASCVESVNGELAAWEKRICE